VLATNEAKKIKTTHSSEERAAALEKFLASRISTPPQEDPGLLI
jgi:hypothetical protein